MKITKARLKQIIKEELALAALEENSTPGDQASIDKAAAIASIVPELDKQLRPASLDNIVLDLLADEIYRISGGDKKKSDHYIKVIAGNIKKTAGNQINDPRAVKVVAKELLEKLKTMPASKPAAGDTEKPEHSAHHQKMKKDAAKRREGEITVTPVRGKSGVRYVASAVKAGKQYKSKSYPNVQGAKADVRDQMAASR